MVKLLYLAKPIYGGWVTFSSMVSKLNNTFIYKISKRTEKKKRRFGYGINYQNTSIDDFNKIDDDILILAIDKNYHHLLDKLPLDKCSIVIHDPTEIKSKKNFILDYLPKMKEVITIRPLVNSFLLELNINNKFLKHPYLRYNKNTGDLNRNGCVSISRIDYDKHTEIILKANQRLENKISVYGDKNDRYVYHKLKEIDNLSMNNPNTCYRGRFGKDYNELYNILKNKKYVIDLSKIKNDGGGTQYTFLEAIDLGCILILNKKWTDVSDSIWKDGVNCLTVENENDLIETLNKNIDTIKIYENSLEILENNTNTGEWIFK